jgi:ectoine hydroxylase-related dioxygenase (phytanoyl-CoA dioxygenase family)
MSQVRSEHIESYGEQGYCLVRDLIPREDLEAVRKRVFETIEDPPAWSKRAWQVIDPSRYTAPAGHPWPGGIQQPSHDEQVFKTVAEHSQLSEAMAAVLGGPVNLFTDQVGVKQGQVTEEQGGRSYFHQDSYYWHIDPALGCNCWIPMQPVDEQAIALAVMPGSQQGWQLMEHETYTDDPPMGGGTSVEDFVSFGRHRIPLDKVDFSSEVLVPMQAGDGLFFSNYTWHRSEPNRTGETMMFYAIAYQRAG